LYATRKLEFCGNGETWEGSGFFYKVLLENSLVSDVLITAAHNVDGASRLKFRVRRGVGSDPIRQPQFAEISTPIYREFVVKHPSEDVCAILTQSFMKEIEKRDGVKTISFTFGDEHVPNEKDHDAITDIIMAGAPIGQYDDYNDHVIFRRGLSASHPGFSYKNRPRFLVDIAAHEGSSGSPLLSWSPFSFNREKGEYELHLQPHFRRLGILVSGLEMGSDHDQALQHAHLGVAIHAAEVKSLAKSVAAHIAQIQSQRGPLSPPDGGSDSWSVTF
jgi:hypothetical protein